MTLSTIRVLWKDAHISVNDEEAEIAIAESTPYNQQQSYAGWATRSEPRWLYYLINKEYALLTQHLFLQYQPHQFLSSPIF